MKSESGIGFHRDSDRFNIEHVGSTEEVYFL